MGYNYEGYERHEDDFTGFRETLKVGSRAPDFTARTLDGESVSLAALRGKKHVVLEFGSIT